MLSGVATPETAMGITMQLPRGCLTIFALRDAIILLVRFLCGVRVLHPARYDAKKKALWLSSSRSDWHAVQRRCQPTPTPIYIYTMFYSVGENRGQLLHI